MKLNQRIQSFLTKQKYKKHRLALRCIMSMMVVFCVVSNLIMPAISMTLQSLDDSYSLKNETVTLLSSETGTVPSDLTAAGSVDLTPRDNTNDYFGLTITADGNTIYNTSNDDKENIGNNGTSVEFKGDNVELEVYMEYSKESISSVLAAIASGNPHLYVNVNTLFGEGTEFSFLDENSKTGPVDDAAYVTWYKETYNTQEEYPAGTFVIGNDGYIRITLTENYITYLTTKGNDAFGTLAFTGTLKRSEGESGDQSFTIGGQEVTVEFYDQKPSLTSKSGTVNSNDGTITWTVVVNNQHTLDLSSYTLQDDMLEHAENVTISPAVGVHTEGSDTVTFFPASKDTAQITITYTTKITEDQLKDHAASNTAYLKKGNDSVDEKSSNASGFNNQNPVSIEKSVSADYDNGTYGEKINWQLIITSTFGTSLDNYIIEDKMLNANATVSPDGSLTSLGNNRWQLSGTNGAKTVTINYQTDATGDTKYDNTATVYHPDNTTKADDPDSKELTYESEKALVSLDKTGKVDKNTGTIEWTITIGNAKKLDLSKYTLSDDMMAKLSSGTNVTIDPSDAGTFENGIIKLNSNTTKTNSITIKYTTDITTEQLKAEKAENTAVLKEGDTKVKDKPSKVELTDSVVTVSKTGTPDYANGNHGGYINWSIRVTSNYGVSLDGYVIKDNMLDVAESISVSSGSLTVDKTTKQGVLSNTNGANSILITYKTPATGGETYTNQAYVYYPSVDGETPTETPGSPSKEEKIPYKNQSELITYQKYGNWEADDHTVLWTIKIKPEGGMSLKDYYLTDEQFSKAVDGITINPATVGNEVWYTLDANGKLTFIKDYTSEVTITYRTNHSIATSVTTTYFSNEIGDSYGVKTTATVPVTARNSIDKYLNQTKTETISNNGQLERTLNWKTELIADSSFANLEYTDTLSATGASGTHTISQEQLNATLIYARQYSNENPGTKLVLNSDYTVKLVSDTSFKIKFSDTIAEKYNYISISYNTTAIANAPTDASGYPYTYTFTNNAGFNGNYDKDSFLLTRNNPEKRDNMVLTIKKNWSGDSVEKPSEIKAKVLYQVNFTGDWYELKGSGTNYLYSGDSGYDSADAYVVTLAADSWTASLTNLPREIIKANADGSQGATTYYSYKIAEIAPTGTVVADKGYYEVADGRYKVNYGGNTGINGSGTISINNTYYANKSVVPKKIWKDNLGNDHVSSIASVTMQLQYSTGSGWYPVKVDSEGNYIFDANGTTEGANVVTEVLTADSSWTGTGWSELPAILLVNNEAKDCSYRVREVKIDDTEISDSTTQYLVSNGYYTISSGTETVTNIFTKNENFTINAEKSWVGDDAYSDYRPEAIILQVYQRPNNTWQWVEHGEPVTVTANDNGIWKASWSVPNQEIIDGKLVQYTYKVEEVGYVYDGTTYNVGKVTANEFATSNNGVYKASYKINDWTYTNELSAAGTVFVTNTFTPVSFTSITPQKKWVGDNESLTERPDSITFTLQRKLSTSGSTWENIQSITLNSDNFTSTESYFDWALNKDVVTTIWKSETVSQLPTSIITIGEDGTYSVALCEYRIIESAYTKNSVTTELNGTTKIKTGNGKYEITYADNNTTVINTYDESIGVVKTIYDRNNNEFGASIDKEDLLTEKMGISDEETDRLEKLKTIEIDGELYYVFNWVVSFEGTENKDLNDVIQPLVDELPTHFSICIDEAIQNADSSGGATVEALLNGGGGYFANPYYLYEQSNFSNPLKPIGKICPNSNTNSWESDYYICPGCDDCWECVFTSEKSEYVFYNPEKTEKNLVGFSKPQITQTQPYKLCYSTKIKVSDFEELFAEGSYTLKNKVNLYEQGTGVDLDLGTSAVLKIVNKIPKDLISKTSSNSRIPGVVNYSLDINPEGKNLSSGSTIDIQDLFKTTSYFDHDKGGGTTTNGDDLVDVVMQLIKLYEVDANGNKIALPSSEYSLILETGDAADEGAALLKLTIPDEKHIVVDYTYKMIANEKTPSVINGCKSSTRVNGRYVTMTPGLVPPAGDKIGISNKASLISDSATDETKEVSQEYVVSKSSSTISTNTYPVVEKINTGGYDVEDSSNAAFLFAMYDNGKWYYATAIDEESFGITWSSTGATGTRIPEGEELAEIKADSTSQLALEQDVLYKLVEISVPSGFEGSNLNLSNDEFETLIKNYLNYGMTYYNETEYAAFLKHFTSVHYFSYNSTMASYPDGLTSDDVTQIKIGDNIEIPNNELIDIGVDKEWINPIGDVTNSEITVELYWSYTKDINDAELAKAEDLGIIDESFSATQTITVGDSANNAVWKDLPNGTNRKPIYYFIKETAYTINGVTYTYDSNYVDGSTTYGKFVSPDGAIGTYQPTYVGNAANTDTVIEVNNSYQLLLKKSWVNSANEPLTKIPTDKVIVSIYGVLRDEYGVETEELVCENIEIAANGSWTTDITDKLVAETDLSRYSSFKAVESAGSSLEEYVVSCVFNINSGTGDITVTNKSTAPTDASVTVNKVWSDSNELHSNQSINVSLYQSEIEITNLNNLSGTLTALGTPIMQKIDEDDTQEYTVALNADNEWSYTWTGLPLDYYYYVLEDMSGVADADKYTAKYEITDQTVSKTEFTVTNTRKAIVIKKEWLDEDNNVIENVDLPTESIGVEVYKKVPTVPEEGLEVYCLGDSITDSYGQGTPYPQQMTGILTGEDYGFKLNNLNNNYIRYSGNSGLKIGTAQMVANNQGCLLGKVGDVSTTADVICLLGGTNDIHQDGTSNPAFINPTECINRLKNWVSAVQDQVPGDDEIIIVGSIPHFFFYKDGKTTTGYTYWNSSFINQYSSIKEAETAANGYIDQYNALIKQFAEETPNVYYAETGESIKDESLIADGCHPNTNGYKAIANAFAAAIKSAYTQDAYVGETTLSAANNWMAAFDIANTDTSIEYYICETDVPSGWDVTYSHKSIKMGSNDPFTITNKRNTPKTNIVVEKTWENDSEDTSGRDDISLTLLRSIDKNSNIWEEVDIETAPTLTMVDNKWTFTYSNLPAEDNFGNQYHYKIEEDPLPGYTVKYGTVIAEAVDGGTANTLTLTNTKAISLTLKKEWSDIDENDHINDRVTLKLYRTTVISERDPGGVELILKVPDTVSLGVGETKSVTANKTLTNVTLKSDPNGAIDTWEWNDKTITITGKADGEAVFEVTDGKETKTITVTVSSLALYLNGEKPEAYTVRALEEGNVLTVKKSDVLVESGVDYESSDETVITVDADGNITALKPGTATITAKVGDFEVTETFTVDLPAAFTVTGGDTVVEGQTLQLGITPPYGSITSWTSKDESIATVTKDGLVKGEAVGSTYIIVTREDGIAVEHPITVQSAFKGVSGEDVSVSDDIQVKVDETQDISYIMLELDTSSKYELHTYIGNWNAKFDIYCENGTLSYNDTDKVKNVVIEGNTVVVYFNDGVNAYVSNNSKSGYVTFHTNSGTPIINSYAIAYEGSGLPSIGGDSGDTGDDDDTGDGGDDSGNTGEGGNTGGEGGNTGGDSITGDGFTIQGSKTISIDSTKTVSTIAFTLSSDTVNGGYSNFTVYIGNYLAGAIIVAQNGTIKVEQEYGGCTYSVSGNVVTLTLNKQADSIVFSNYNGTNVIDSYTITYASTSSTSFSLRNTSLTLGDAGETEILADEDIAPLAEDGISTTSLSTSGLNFVAIRGDKQTEVANVDIQIMNTGGQNWITTIDNLEACDENGNPYYYWVVEEPVFTNYDVSYSFNDSDDSEHFMINAEQLDSSAEYDIIIRNTKNESVTVEMPSTGGEGTTWYYIVGIMIVLGSAAGLIVIKRRQMVKR